MGTDIEDTEFTPEDHDRFAAKLRADLEALREMLATGAFATTAGSLGVEMEFYVVDGDGRPTAINDELLERMESDDFQTELAQFNIEFNLHPHDIVGSVLGDIEDELAASYGHATGQAAELGAEVAMIGILPTLEESDLTLSNLSGKPRYHLLNQQILAARGEDLRLTVDGVEDRLDLTTSTIAIEAAATSMQLHLETTPDELPRAYNTAAAVSAAQVAMGCNAPWLLGRRLLAETRIAVFEQGIDTRSEREAAEGARPRVWFGDRWIEEAIQPFEENVDYFRPLLPVVSDEDPKAVVAAGAAPELSELTLHNSTVWRWNRPVYGRSGGRPHLRIENRVLPAGPSLTDSVANAAFYYGLVAALLRRDPPISERMSFAEAHDNFRAAVRHGIDAQLSWPEVGRVPATRLVLQRLLPLAHEGLERLGIDPGDREHYLGVIEQRARQRVNGAAWQVRAVRELEEGGLDRRRALGEMTRRYLANMRANRPVHEWELPG